MKIFIIILLIIGLLNLIDLELDLYHTVWIEKSTDRPIIVIDNDYENGITYKYAGDYFVRTMSLFELITKFKYNGRETK